MNRQSFAIAANESYDAFKHPLGASKTFSERCHGNEIPRRFEYPADDEAGAADAGTHVQGDGRTSC